MLNFEHRFSLPYDGVDCGWMQWIIMNNEFIASSREAIIIDLLIQRFSDWNNLREQRKST